MSDIDLSAAVEAAARAIFEAMWATEARPCPTWEDVPPPAKHHHRESVLPAVAAAAPLIEQAVREQVAAEIEAQLPNAAGMAQALALKIAARIARGGAS